MNRSAVINNSLRTKDRNSPHNNFKRLSNIPFLSFKYDGEKIYAGASTGLYVGTESSFPGTPIQGGDWGFVYKGVRNGKTIIGAIKQGAGINAACFYEGNIYFASTSLSTLASMCYSPTNDRWYLFSSGTAVECYSMDLSTFYWSNPVGIPSIVDVTVVNDKAYLLKNSSVYVFSTVSNSIVDSFSFSPGAQSIYYLERLEAFSLVINTTTYITKDFINFSMQENDIRGIIDTGDFYILGSSNSIAIGKSRRVDGFWSSMSENPRSPSESCLKIDYAKRKVVIQSNLGRLYISSEL